MNETISKPGKIYSAIPAVIGDIGAVGKNGTNKDQHYKYRSIDDVYSALNPALAKNGVFINPEVIELERGEARTRNGGTMQSVVVTMRYTVYADDGSYIVATSKGQAMDTSDKAINKAYAFAFKYLCFQLFCIPVEDMIDGDSESPKPERAATNSRKPTSRNSRAASNGDTAPTPERITPAMLNTIRAEQKQFPNATDEKILTGLHTKAGKLEELNVEEFKRALKMFDALKTRAAQATAKDTTDGTTAVKEGNEDEFS